MIAIELTIIASYLYHTDPSNPLRFEIYKATANTHPKDDINHVFSDKDTKDIQSIEAILKRTNKPKKRRK